MKKVLLYAWQLPQNLVGLIYGKIVKAIKLGDYYGARTYYHKYGGSVTLGDYIYLDKHAGEKTLRHEYGHTMQSKILGWLYLIVIGLPSILHAIVHTKGDYYHFYTEKWANKLADKKFKKDE